ncbi:MAG: L,D-transpeptidase family protein, partial [Ruminococcus sp.]|nr:L,D-transpeptidase family protein [Ruminococcus sp.]
KRRRKSRAPLYMLLFLLLLVGAAALAYYVGLDYYKDKFTANTFVNGENVSGMKLESAATLFKHDEIPETIKITRPNEEVVEIPLDAVDYEYSYDAELKKIFDDIDRKSWFASYFKKTDYNFTDVASYDSDKLDEQIDSADWGSEENQDAVIKSNSEGYYIQSEVQGDVFDMDTMRTFVHKSLSDAEYSVNGLDSGAYIPPEKPSDYFEQKVETLNKMWNIKICYDFNYTKEKLTGKELCKLLHVRRDGSYTVDVDKCEAYIEGLAKKYDTYNTKRKFKATIQGRITVPTSDDAKYGWWLDQQANLDELVKMLENGKTKKKVEPIYWKEGNFEFVGLPSDRSEKSDIGDTYIEVDLTNQQWWYYKKGKKKRHGYVVSGQTTSAARTTLPGVYKVWQKDTNYRMKDRNADGETWDTTCNYWNRIAIVGIGMHDSTWRGAFGGDIYKYNGSHGCINMTYDDAKYIYDNVAFNTPVVMYY